MEGCQDNNMGPERASLNDPSSSTTTTSDDAQPPLPPEEDHNAPGSSTTQTAEELRLFVSQQLITRIKELERDQVQLNSKLEKFNKKEQKWNEWRVEQADTNRLVLAELKLVLLSENEGIADAYPSVSVEVVEFRKEKLDKVGKKLEEAEKDKEEDERVFKELTDEIDSLKEQLNETKIDRKQKLELKDARIRELEAGILELKIQKSAEEQEKKTLEEIQKLLDKSKDRNREETQLPEPRLPKKQDKKAEDVDIKPIGEVDQNTDMTVALLPNATGFNMNASSRKKTSGNEDPVEAPDFAEIEKQLQVVHVFQPNGSRPTLAPEYQLKMCPKIILHRCILNDYKEKVHESKKKVRFESRLESSRAEADEDHEVDSRSKMKKQEVVITPAPGNGMELVPFRKRRGSPSKLTSIMLSSNGPRQPQAQGGQSSIQQKTFKCLWCPFSSNCIRNLRRHMMRMHQSIISWSGCSQCGKIFSSRKAYFDHRRKFQKRRRTPKTGGKLEETRPSKRRRLEMDKEFIPLITFQ